MPEFETDGERSYFIARLYVHELFTGEGVAHEGGDVAHEEEGDTPELDDFIRAEIRRNATVTREEIAKSAGVSKKTVERHLAKMEDVRYVGSGSNGHWEISE